MKKLISLIASISLVATMFTTAYAAELANNRPVVNSAIEELGADEYKAIAYEDLPEGCHAYYVTVNVTGLDLEVKATGTGLKKRTGLLLKSASYQIDFDDDSNFVAAFFDDGILEDGCTEEQLVYGGKAWMEKTAGIPETTNGDSTGKTVNSIDMCGLVVVTKGELTGKVYSEFSVQIVNDSTLGEALYIDKAHAVQATYTVDGEATSTITFGATSTPDPDEPGEDEGDEDITISDRFTLENLGYAWDVTINNYDSNKTYTATFKAPGESDKVHDLSFTVEADNGTIAFAALLKTTKANVELAIAKN